MSHTTSLRRTASALGATAALGMLLAAPALARQDPGTGGPVAQTSATSDSSFPYGLDRARREGSVSAADSSFPYGLDRARREGSSSGIDRNRQLGGFTFSKELSTLPEQVAKPATPTVVTVDHDTVEYLQVGAGLLAAAVIAGAGAVIVSRRSSGNLTPA